MYQISNLWIIKMVIKVQLKTHILWMEKALYGKKKFWFVCSADKGPTCSKNEVLKILI